MGAGYSIRSRTFSFRCSICFSRCPRSRAAGFDILAKLIHPIEIFGPVQQLLNLVELSAFRRDFTRIMTVDEGEYPFAELADHRRRFSRRQSAMSAIHVLLPLRIGRLDIVLAPTVSGQAIKFLESMKFSQVSTRAAPNDSDGQAGDKSGELSLCLVQCFLGLRSSEYPACMRGHWAMGRPPGHSGSQVGEPLLVRVIVHCCGQPAGESSHFSCRPKMVKSSNRKLLSIYSAPRLVVQ